MELSEVLHLVSKVSNDFLFNSKKKQGLNYIHKERGISLETIKDSFIGEFPEKLEEHISMIPGIEAHLRNLGILNGNGYEKWKNRIVMPIYDIEHKMVALTSRSYHEDTYYPNHCHTADVFGFPPFYGLNNFSTHDLRPILIVESPICALSLKQYGFSSLATIGMPRKTALPFLSDLLRDYKREAILIPDIDPHNAGVDNFLIFAYELFLKGHKPKILQLGPLRSPKKLDVNTVMLTTPNFKTFLEDKISASVPIDKTQFFGKEKRMREEALKRRQKLIERQENIRSEYERARFEYSIQEVANALGIKISTRTSKDRSSAICPFHSDSKASLVLYHTTNSWFCFGSCNTGGSIFELINKSLGLNYSNALKWLFDNFGERNVK